MGWAIDSILTQCLECGKETKNPEFCSVKCACRDRNRNLTYEQLSYWARHPKTEEHQRKITEALKGRRPSDNTIAAVIVANTGRVPTQEWRKEHSERIKHHHKIGTYTTDAVKESRRKVGLANLGRKASNETRSKMRASASHTHSEEHTAKVRRTKLQSWQDPTFASKMFRSWGIKPNSKELFIKAILDELYPNQWIYVGDGKIKEVIIGRRCPDLWDGDHKFIEHYGDYYHRGQNPQDRIGYFKKYGFDCLIIWEHELKDKMLLKEKIKSYVEGGDYHRLGN